LLNTSDECSNLEAKKGSSIDKSILETICAFSNEPGLGGGIIILGIKEADDTLFSSYKVTGIDNPDKLQKDLATQCADQFNQPVRPKISVEEVNSKNVLIIEVPELAPEQKPLFFKNQGLPQGAFRRIGSTDQRCTEDDLYFFYGKEDEFDGSVIYDSDIDDVSYEAVELYRQLRAKVNPTAEELSYDDIDLLRALNCVKKVNGEWRLTNAGLIVFGKKMALRRLMPMVRVDYVRIPGKTWIENPDERFSESLDMRGPIIELVSRTISTIADDLPKGFALTEHSIQAESKSMLPVRVLREAIVNAFIHRTYRVNQPIQILRYSNRLEIINAGYSLKPDENIGEPGSVNRNAFISAIFHDTNLAETKGTGYKTMQKLMKAAQMMPPTFESNRQKNNFTLRLLFHNLLNKDDLLWLGNFNDKKLNDNQKSALVFLREVEAIDNNSYRQLTGASRSEAGIDLREMRNKNLIEQKNIGKLTYYLPTLSFWGTMVDKSLTMVDKSLTMVDKSQTMVDKNSINKLKEEIPDNIANLVRKTGKRSRNPKLIRKAILELCAWRDLSIAELAELLHRNEKYIKTHYIQSLIDEGEIAYTIPAMLTHPNQKYKTISPTHNNNASNH
jgi:ATP-dependent DNA helicase RecG